MTASPAAEQLLQAAEALRDRSYYAETGEADTALAYDSAVADLLEAASLDPDIEREHDACARTICASAAVLAVARLILGRTPAAVQADQEPS